MDKFDDLIDSCKNREVPVDLELKGRISLEELELRGKKAKDEAREALIKLSEYVSEKADETLEIALEKFSDAALHAIHTAVDYCSYKMHVDTIEGLLADPKLKEIRHRIKKHRGFMEWAQVKGVDQIIPIMTYKFAENKHYPE